MQEISRNTSLWENNAMPAAPTPRPCTPSFSLWTALESVFGECETQTLKTLFYSASGKVGNGVRQAIVKFAREAAKQATTGPDKPPSSASGVSVSSTTLPWRSLLLDLRSCALAASARSMPVPPSGGGEKQHLDNQDEQKILDPVDLSPFGSEIDHSQLVFLRSLHIKNLTAATLPGVNDRSTSWSSSSRSSDGRRKLDIQAVLSDYELDRWSLPISHADEQDKHGKLKFLIALYEALGEALFLLSFFVLRKPKIFGQVAQDIESTLETEHLSWSSHSLRSSHSSYSSASSLLPPSPRGHLTQRPDLTTAAKGRKVAHSCLLGLIAAWRALFAIGVEGQKWREAKQDLEALHLKILRERKQRKRVLSHKRRLQKEKEKASKLASKFKNQPQHKIKSNRKVKIGERITVKEQHRDNKDSRLISERNERNKRNLKRDPRRKRES